MVILHEQFVVDKDGNQTAVWLDIQEYNTLLEALEELESIKAYDSPKSSEDEAIPFDLAIKEYRNNDSASLHSHFAEAQAEIEV